MAAAQDGDGQENDEVMPRIGSNDRELLDLLGEMADKRASKEAAEKARENIRAAEQYAKELRAEAEAEKRESEALRDKNRREARKVLEDAREASWAAQEKIDKQNKDIRLERMRLEEWARELSSQEGQIKTEKAKAQSERMAAEEARVNAEKAEKTANEARKQVDIKLARMTEIWQHST